MPTADDFEDEGERGGGGGRGAVDDWSTRGEWDDDVAAYRAAAPDCMGDGDALEAIACVPSCVRPLSCCPLP